MAEEKLTWQNRCQKCGKLRKTTMRRTIKTKLYQGPCGDSFCYASCDMETCHPITVTICDACAALLGKPA